MKKFKQTIAALSMLLFLLVINSNVKAQSFFISATATPPCGYPGLFSSAPNPTDQWFDFNVGGQIVWVGETFTPTTGGQYRCLSAVHGWSYNTITVYNAFTPVITFANPVDTLCPPATNIQLSPSTGIANSYAWSPATGLNQTTGSTVLASPTVTTTYTVVATGSPLCTASATIKIVVKPVPNPLTATNITGTSAVLNWSKISCATGYTVQYKVSGATTWSTKQVNTNTNSTAITGLLLNTKYQWKVKTKFSSGSSNYSTSNSFKTKAARISETANDNNISLFPNPTTGVFTIAMNDCIDCTYMINVYDILGNLVFTEKNTAGSESKTIDLSHLAKGIYHVQVNNNGLAKNTRLVIQ